MSRDINAPVRDWPQATMQSTTPLLSQDRTDVHMERSSLLCFCHPAAETGKQDLKHNRLPKKAMQGLIGVNPD